MWATGTIIETMSMKKVKDLEKVIPCFSEEPENLRYCCLPQRGFEAERGDSWYIPDRDEVPKRYNPDGKTWGEIFDKYGIEGILFKEGYPDFSVIAQAETKIDDFTTDRSKNFAQADKKLAEQWNQEGKDGKNDWKPSEIKAYREENRLTWHEKEDMQTMQLVPSEVHNNIPHAGGIAKAKENSDS